MLEEEIVKYETAKLAHKKGFDGICIYQYTMDKYNEPYLYETPYYSCGRHTAHGFNGFISREDLIEDYDILAPSQSLLQMWLREIHEIYIVIDPNNNAIVFTKLEIGAHAGHNIGKFKTYEEALENGLQKALKIIK